MYGVENWRISEMGFFFKLANSYCFSGIEPIWALSYPKKDHFSAKNILLVVHTILNHLDKNRL